MYDALFAFSKQFVREARAFQNSNVDNLDIVRLNAFDYLRVQRVEFDFKTANVRSRLHCIDRRGGPIDDTSSDSRKL